MIGPGSPFDGHDVEGVHHRKNLGRAGGVKAQGAVLGIGKYRGGIIEAPQFQNGDDIGARIAAAPDKGRVRLARLVERRDGARPALYYGAPKPDWDRLCAGRSIGSANRN